MSFVVGWRFGNSDKTILIQENEKTINKFDAKKRFLERQLTDTRLKLKEANLALDIQNIKGKQSKFWKSF